MITGTLLSTILYRTWFHPLRQFKGPLLGRLSKAYVLFLSMKNTQLFIETRKLHERYGDFVRAGPNDLFISDPAAIKAIHSKTTSCIPGPWHEYWDLAFKENGEENESRVKEITKMFLGRIENKKESPIDITEYLHFWIMDIAAKAAFDESLHLVEGADEDQFLNSIAAFTHFFGVYGHLTWIVPFINNIPMIKHKLQTFINKATGHMKQRMERKDERLEHTTFGSSRTVPPAISALLSSSAIVGLIYNQYIRSRWRGWWKESNYFLLGVEEIRPPPAKRQKRGKLERTAYLLSD
ncbi:Cytochrome P450 monooxygenase FCK2 [Aspergillus affinis]|uniref:Cytochrome P450 monooxygenase FCK2 n=1 Tax=Aspergillus affinis TaxID=1070780 RepID=UPI0022FF2637|nr:Cytochrome P450 monooxygenase FCK2 [Aspergillus affinis]KAI9040311.1 Cytochrome P450 monooxygenase FCK2 [Aspergillus affinis]